MSVALGLDIAQKGFGMFAQYQANKDNIKKLKQNMAITKRLAAESLATTYNSILAMSRAANLEQRRAEIDIKLQTRKAEGQAVAASAATGATGRRVQLAINQETAGAADRALGRVARAGKDAQDDLIARADMEAKSTVNRLISSAPDLPNSFDPLVTGLKAGIGAYSAYLDDKEFTRLRKEAAAKTD